MNWKFFITAFVSLFILVFPQNIIGCGGADYDPYDYYTSFFSKKLTGDESHRPFYYTALRFMNDWGEPISTKEATSAEWVGYSNHEATKKDVQEFVLTYPYKHLSNLYYHLEKKQPLTLPDSAKKNSFTKWFMKTKDLEALGYLMYAKQVEPFVIGDEDSWGDVNRDAVKMNKLIANGIQLWKAGKKDFTKLRYGYQVIRLGHYNQQYSNCISDYDLYVKNNPTKSILQDLSLSLRAGALKHIGKKDEAAYEFSKVFARERVKRRSNYLSFFFTTREENNQLAVTKENVLRYCKNNAEKANVTGMFLLSSAANTLPSLEQMYKLDAGNALLELMTIRAINRLEELYLTPSIKKLKGDPQLYSYYRFDFDANEKAYDSIYRASEQEAKAMITFCHKLAQDAKVPNRGLYETAAAYAAYISNNIQLAKTLLSSAETLNLNGQLKDQCMLTKLLVTLTEQPTINAAFEEQLLPSVQWIESKAKKDDEWKVFYRNLFTEILANRYRQQQDIMKEVLCIGAAEKIMMNPEWANAGYYYGSNKAVTFLRSEINSKEVEKLYALMQSSSKTRWEAYLTVNNSFTKDDVSDIAGTAYLREFDFTNAERWFKQVSPAYYKSEPYQTNLAANPFADLIYDTHAPTDQDTKTYTKLSFVQTMKALQTKASVGSKEEKAKAIYQMANGLYQMSYWGNSWMLVEYGWSGNDGLSATYKEGTWQREYFGIFTAEKFYLQAKELSGDVNIKARCIWMAAKCSQKQYIVPAYSAYTDYDLYDKATGQYAKDIKKNKYFHEFVSTYRKTNFYTEVFNSCVYLKDYVNGK
jgi:hypothetical protein